MIGAENAAASELQFLGRDVAGAMLQAINASIERKGEAPLSEHITTGIEPLLAGAWNLNKLANGDGPEARALFAGFLRRFADNLE